MSNLGLWKKVPGEQYLEPGTFRSQVRHPSNLGPKVPGDNVQPLFPGDRISIFVEPGNRRRAASCPKPFWARRAQNWACRAQNLGMPCPKYLEKNQEEKISQKHIFFVFFSLCQIQPFFSK